MSVIAPSKQTYAREVANTDTLRGCAALFFRFPTPRILALKILAFLVARPFLGPVTTMDDRARASAKTDSRNLTRLVVFVGSSTRVTSKSSNRRTIIIDPSSTNPAFAHLASLALYRSSTSNSCVIVVIVIVASSSSSSSSSPSSLAAPRPRRRLLRLP